MLKNTMKGTTEKIGKALNNISMPIKTTKIAITGLSRSGKTIFITSLIDQLLHQKKIHSMTQKYKKFSVNLKFPKVSVKRFEYHPLKKIIKEYHQWPEGTDNITSTTLEFEVKSRYSFVRNSKFRVELIDYPGEWILDIKMLELSYEQWNEKIIAWMRNINEDIVKEYLKVIDNLSDKSKGEELGEKLHKQYVDMIRYLKDNHFSNITPGRFLMPSDLLDDPVLYFAPINNSSSTLYAEFKKKYDEYLENVVKNIQLEHFEGFDRQIVLVDIIEALQNGPQCYGDMKDGLKSMLSLYDHRNKNFISQWFSSSIRNVIFVATKADLITTSQHNNFSALLNEMVEDIKNELDIHHIKTEAQVIAAVKCTQIVKCEHDGKPLSCIRGVDPEDNIEVELFPGEMPSSFPLPNQWNTSNYAYEAFLPAKNSYKDNEPFEHINMDKVIESIIGDLL